MSDRLVTFFLVALVFGLAVAGALTKDTAVLTLAAAALTGLFAWLQAPNKP